MGAGDAFLAGVMGAFVHYAKREHSRPSLEAVLAIGAASAKYKVQGEVAPPLAELLTQLPMLRRIPPPNQKLVD